MPIEVAVERLIESSEPTLRIGSDRCYVLDGRLHVRVRPVGRTAGGRQKLELTNVIDVTRPVGEPYSINNNGRDRR